MPTHFSILSIFPEIFSGFLTSSLIKKAIDKEIINIDLVNFRDYAEPPHFKVDDEIYGGGAGMLLKPEPIIKAIEAEEKKLRNPKVILLSAAGEKYTQEKAIELSKIPEQIIICGRYEGVDQRVIESKVDYEISIGDFICMGGEVPAMLVIESVTRLLDDALGNPESIIEESFCIQDGEQKLIEAPQYTRPSEFRDMKVPEVLVSGDHEKIKAWRKEQAQKRTKKNRPDL